MTIPLNVLVFTPTPTHPPVQGNRQRVFDMCRALQSVGAEMTVLYHSTEGISAAEARLMRGTWGDLEVIFPSGFVPKQSLVRYPTIDDWYDDMITDAVARLCQRKRFDVCVVNYVWYSKLFEALPDSVVRVIDTHDLFGGRAERFAELGLAPEWFYTSIAQETLGLDRSDFVVAIQKEEARTLQARTSSNVRTVGFLSAPNFMPPSGYKAGAPLKAGYIGSGNPFNVSSMLSFARAVHAVSGTTAAIEFHVAGAICAALRESSHAFVLHGMVDSLPEFYRSIDVAINPMSGGTGLKIKSLEALSFGKPLAATTDAMAGINSLHAGHRLGGPDDVVRWLMELSANPARLAEEAAESRRVFQSYRKAQLHAFLGLWSEIRDRVADRVALGNADSIGASP